MPTNISTFLANDHGRLLGLFREYREVDDDKLDERQRRFSRFRCELKRHGRWVGSTLIERIRPNVDESHREKLDRFLEEEQHGFRDQAGEIEQKLEAGAPDTEQVENELLSSMKNHFTREEKVLYPMFDQYLSEEEQEELIETFNDELGVTRQG